jgi:hypothetical protein
MGLGCPTPSATRSSLPSCTFLLTKNPGGEASEESSAFKPSCEEIVDKENQSLNRRRQGKKTA